MTRAPSRGRASLAEFGQVLKRSRVGVLKLAPGDVLVLEVPGAINDESAKRIKAYMDGVLPDQKTLVLSDGMKLRAVRPSSTPRRGRS